MNSKDLSRKFRKLLAKHYLRMRFGRTDLEKTALKSGLDCVELNNLLECLIATEHLKGSVLEVGVGGSSKIISRTAFGKVYFVDTFKGLPYSQGRFKKGDYKTSFSEFNEKHLGVVIPGEFCEAKNRIVRERFRFVHVDVDLKEVITEILSFLKGKMVRGGLVLVHDYPDNAVAIDSFCYDNKIIKIPLLYSQALLIY